jgi:hypothetical protein
MIARPRHCNLGTATVRIIAKNEPATLWPPSLGYAPSEPAQAECIAVVGATRRFDGEEAKPAVRIAQGLHIQGVEALAAVVL